MKVKPYPWQIKLAEKYKGKGIVEAAPGSGKTLGAILLIKKRQYKNILIAVPTLPLKNQWLQELKKQNVQATIKVETFHRLYKPEHESTQTYELLIVDECHRSISPKFIKLYKYQKYEHILGLSATPNKLAERLCGKIIISVSLQEANIAKFKVVFTSIELTPNERVYYDQYTYKLGNILNRIEDRRKNREIIDAIIYKRRGIVYKAKNRIPKTFSIMEQNKDKNILVICQRIEQANQLSKLTSAAVFHSENKKDQTLQDFKDGKIKTLISVGMLKEGFDKRDIDVLIIASTALTKAAHIQSLGRAIRLPNDAIIYILLARDTTDEKLLKFKNMYDYSIQGKFTGKYDEEMPEIAKQYYKSKSYSLDSRFKIFERTENGRKYFEDNPIIPILRKHLPGGGRFRITKSNKVLIKKDNKIEVVDTLTEPLQHVIEVLDTPNKLDWDALTKDWK